MLSFQQYCPSSGLAGSRTVQLRALTIGLEQAPFRAEPVAFRDWQSREGYRQHGLGGTVNSDCQLVVGTIAIDGVRVLESGRIDHSMLRIFRTDDAQSPRFDPDAVRELVLSLTRLPRDVILIPRDPVRTVEGIKMPVSVKLDMFGTSFDVGEVCIGLDGRCRQQLTNLREVRIDLVEKSGELRGSHRWNVRSQSHYLTAPPFPIGLSKGSQQRAHTGSGTAPVV
jgi:hypothetical protein